MNQYIAEKIIDYNFYKYIKFNKIFLNTNFIIQSNKQVWYLMITSILRPFGWLWWIIFNRMCNWNIPIKTSSVNKPFKTQSEDILFSIAG